MCNCLEHDNISTANHEAEASTAKHAQTDHGVGESKVLLRVYANGLPIYDVLSAAADIVSCACMRCEGATRGCMHRIHVFCAAAFGITHAGKRTAAAATRQPVRNKHQPMSTCAALRHPPSFRLITLSNRPDRARFG